MSDPTPTRDRRNEVIDALVDALNALLADHEQTAQNSHRGACGEHWREVWQSDDEDDYALCQRARAALAKAEAL